MTGALGTAATAARPPPRRPIRLPRLRRRTLAALIVVGVVGLVAFNVGRQAFVGWSIGEQAAISRPRSPRRRPRTRPSSGSSSTSRATPTSRLRRAGSATSGYPGEQVLVIPAGAAVEAPAGATSAPVDERPMLERWLDLFLGTTSP